MMTISLAEYSQQKSTMTNNKLPHLANILQLLNSNCRVALQWIPAHCGVPRNKQTDTVAKQGAQTEQPGANVSYQENAIITKALMMPSQAKDACHLLSRPEQVIMVRLRTGTNQSNSHMYNKLKIVPSASCLLVRKIDRQRSIYSKTVKGMTRKDLQLDQLRRHSIRNYLVTDNRVHPCYWSDRVRRTKRRR